MSYRPPGGGGRGSGGGAAGRGGRNQQFTHRPNKPTPPAKPEVPFVPAAHVAYGTGTTLTNHFEIVFPTSSTQATTSTTARSAPNRSKATTLSSRKPPVSPTSSSSRKTPVSPKSSPPRNSPVPPTSSSQPPAGSSNSVAVTAPDFTLYRYDLSVDRRLTDEEKKIKAERDAKKNESKDKGKGRASDDGSGRPAATNPREASAKVRRRLVYLLIKQLHQLPELATIRIATDYSSFLVTCAPLPASMLNRQHQVILYGDHEHAPGGYPLFIFSISTTPLILSMTSLLGYLQDTGNFQLSDKNAAVSALNAIVTNAANISTFTDLNPTIALASQTVARAGSKKFFVLASLATANNQIGPVNLAGSFRGLMGRLGYFLSTRALKGNHRVLLNINTARSAFFHEGQLDTYINFLMAPPNNFPWHSIEQWINGLQFATTHRRPANGANEKLYKVVARDHTAQNICFASNTNISGTPTMTVLQYFQQNYPQAQIVAKDILVPVDNKTPPAFLPAKVLRFVPGQRYKKKTEMVDFAVQLPIFNRNQIDSAGKRIFELQALPAPGSGSPVSFSSSIVYGPLTRRKVAMFNGLGINQNMLSISMPVVNGPDLVYPTRPGHSRGMLQDHERNLGSWNLRDRQFNTPARGGSWSVLQIYDRQPSPLLPFVNVVKSQLPEYGMASQLFTQSQEAPDDQQAPNIDLDNWHKIRRDEAMDEKKLGQMLGELFPDTARNPRLVFIMLPQRDTALYQIVKCAADNAGIHTICQVMRGGRPVIGLPNIGNMLMKFNLKMSRDSVNQRIRAINNNQIPYLNNSTMLIGMDVTHPPPEAMAEAPSIAALVGSVNDDYSQFPAVIRENAARKDGRPNEEIMQLEEMVKISVKRWMDRHGGRMPARIIAFRDGLSEEQLDMCKAFEIERMRNGIKASKRSAADPDPELLVICTVKRHHVRFFPPSQGGSTAYNGNNPRPGSMVDTDVVSGGPNNKEYFLTSHTPLQGTARPVHYIPLRSTMRTALDTKHLARMVSPLLNHSVVEIFC